MFKSGSCPQPVERSPIIVESQAVRSSADDRVNAFPRCFVLGHEVWACDVCLRFCGVPSNGKPGLTRMRTKAPRKGARREHGMLPISQAETMSVSADSDVDCRKPPSFCRAKANTHIGHTSAWEACPVVSGIHIMLSQPDAVNKSWSTGFRRKGQNFDNNMSHQDFTAVIPIE